MHLGRPEMLKSHGGKRYTLVVRNDFSRYTWVYFMRHESDAAETFKQFLSDTRADDVPSQVVTVRSDGGGEFQGGSSATCVDRDALSKNSPRPTVPNSMR